MTVRRSALLLLASLAVPAPSAPVSTVAAAATAHPTATEAALAILRAGGNAVDAAVAAALTLGVVEPHASGLGGGGFLVIRMASPERTEVINCRETAPAAASLEMWLGPDGAVVTERVNLGGTSVGVPGTVAGLWEAHQRHGALAWADVVGPAIAAADAGVTLTPNAADIMLDHLDIITQDPGLAALYAPEGLPLDPGQTMHSAELAATLRSLAAEGGPWFYTGPVAGEMVRVVRERGGVLTSEDLANCQPSIQEPVAIPYRGHTILTIGLPSSGAVIIARVLHALETVDLAPLGAGTTASIDLIARTIAEAAEATRPFAGDPLGLPPGVTLETLLSAESPALSTDAVTGGSGSTTHLSLIDSQGNAVALTQTIGHFHGAGIRLPESGVMLNDQISDFTFPNSPLWRDGGGNHPLPGARPASSMAPMIVLDAEGRVIAVLGSPGGLRIPAALVEILVNFIDHGMDVDAAVAAPRFHPSPGPSRRLDLEGGHAPEIAEDLRALGWDVREREALDNYFGGAQMLVRDPRTGEITGTADPRRDGSVGGL